ncbi:co-chaperone GroES [Candidatus Wolfebacteria bacterium]|nr:co-chaperone GroES [Candidatus Wolfebacteria bacterium]
MVSKSAVPVTPLGDRVLVRPLSEEELGVRTASGIIIPETVDREKPEQGKVVAVGEGRYDDGKLVKPSVKVGDRVVFSRYGFDEVKMGGVEYYIIKSENVLAIVK